MHKGKVCPAYYPERKYTFSKATSEQCHCIINHIPGQISASAVVLLMLRTAIYPSYHKFRICTVNRSFKVHSPVLLMVLFYCLSLTQLDTLPLYIAHPTFFILSQHNSLNSPWNSSAFKTRPSTQYCETISTVNEKVNVTYKMSINLMSLHFNGTLTQRRIKLLPRDQPNHLAPWRNHPPTSQQTRHPARQ